LEFESELEFDFSTEIEYKIGDPADPANQGQYPNPHHDSVLAQLADFVRLRGWGDIRREQTQAEIVRRYDAGVPMAILLSSGVFDSPVSSRSAAIRAARSIRQPGPRRRRQREAEGEWLFYL
jgi:hypothetical protein